MNTRTTMTIIAIAALLGLIILYAFTRPEEQESIIPEVEDPREPAYTNETYGYSFSYPALWGIEEYSPESVVVGTTTTEGFYPLVEVAYVDSDDVAYESFDELLVATGRTLCAADGPGASIDCPGIASQEPYVTENGLAAVEIHYELVQSNLTAATSATTTFGPVYAFTVDPADASAGEVVLVYQPLSTALNESAHLVVREVAQSFTFDADQTDQ